MYGHAEAEVYCEEFAHYIPIGAEGTASEGKVKPIEVVLLNLIPRIQNFKHRSKDAFITECIQMLKHPAEKKHFHYSSGFHHTSA